MDAKGSIFRKQVIVCDGFPDIAPELTFDKKHDILFSNLNRSLVKKNKVKINLIMCLSFHKTNSLFQGLLSRGNPA
jgi:hypothetical protein